MINTKAKKKLLVLLPGIDGTGRLFAPFSRMLDPTFETKVLSYPGDRRRNYDELSSVVLRELPKTPCVIVAESFSGPVALKVAARNPRSLKAVILSTSFVVNPRPWVSVFFGWLIAGWLFRVPPPNWMLRLFAVDGAAGNDLCRAVKAALRTISPDVLAFRLREIVRLDATNDLVRCPVPVFYLHGTFDRLVGRNAVVVIQSIRPDVEVYDVPGPHLLLQSAPEKCAKIIDRVTHRVCAE